MKLAVGVRDPAHLRALQYERTTRDPPLQHRTRQMPKRMDEIVAGGSLYWVIAGSMLVRQRVIGIEKAIQLDGQPCAAILLDTELIPVMPRPVRPFQGWRYLAAEDAPDDLGANVPEPGFPPGMARKLRELCLL